MIELENYLLRYALSHQDFEPSDIDLYIEKTTAGAEAGEQDSLQSRASVLRTLDDDASLTVEDDVATLLSLLKLTKLKDDVSDLRKVLDSVRQFMTAEPTSKLAARMSLKRLSDALKLA